MRRIFVTGLCALYLAFGSVAGLAHVHEAAGHHEESRGVHLDHAHVDHHVDHHHADSRTGRDDAGVQTDSQHVDHHIGDAVYLSQSAIRSLPNVRVLPTIVSDGPAIESPSLVSEFEGDRPGRPRDPPGKIPPRLRAPPA
jgi:hypothetical protein